MVHLALAKLVLLVCQQSLDASIILVFWHQPAIEIQDPSLEVQLIFSSLQFKPFLSALFVFALELLTEAIDAELVASLVLDIQEDEAQDSEPMLLLE